MFATVFAYAQIRVLAINLANKKANRKSAENFVNIGETAINYTLCYLVFLSYHFYFFVSKYSVNIFKLRVLKELLENGL